MRWIIATRIDGFTGLGQILVIFGQPAVAIEPPEGALDDPAFWDDHKALEVASAW